MKKFISKAKKVATCVLTAAMVLTSVTPWTPAKVQAATVMSITESAGWLETAYVEWAPVSGAKSYRAYVKSASAPDSSYVQLDDELIRTYNGYMRADALGLAAGNYVMHVEAVLTNGSVVSATTKSVTVLANDRSGFAFSSKSTFGTASGAYNDNGTLKSNAQVVYVTPSTAKTCTAVVNGTKVTGFQSILDAKQSAGTKDTTPIDFRIIGCIKASDVDHFSSSSEGIQIKGKSAYTAMNITIEGVGEDAAVHGFGFLIRNAGNLEIRNLGVMNFMDDGISIDSNNCNIWIHNVDIFYGATGSDSDQAKGDGSVDIKGKSTNVTVSYVHFWDSGKCSLCGMSDTAEFLVTYHHNWFDHSDSRHPRIRVASVHLYNNYFDGNAKYGVGTTKGSNAFVEANYFNNCKNPMMSSMQGTDAKGEGTFSGENGGMIKAYNNIVKGASSLVYANSNNGTSSADSKSFDAYLASSRTEKVPTSYKTVAGGTTYNNFDTSSSYDLAVSTSKIDAPANVPSIVTKYAGRMNGGDFKWTFTDSDNSNYSVNSSLKSAVVNYKSSLVSIGGNGSKASATVDKNTTTETQTQAPTQAQTEKQTETQKQTEAQTQKQTEAQTQAPTQAPTEAQTQPEKVDTTTSGSVKFTSVGGWMESIYAQISGVSDSNVTGVSYSGTMSGSLSGDDLKYLVRDNNGGVRIDIPGLKPGTYSLSVKTSKGTISASGIVVTAYDRSGYAHFNYTAGVGAYNDNGTLKSNAIVLYVTNDNKDSVTVTSKDGTKVTGIGNILNSAGQDTGSGKTSNGGTPNSNAGIIKKLALDGTPLVIRFVGTVKAPKGLTAYDSVNYGGSVGDNGYMARMKSGANITLEGIGTDAVIDGWGFHFMCESSAPTLGKSFEARNLIFKNTPEDAIGMEGVQEGSTITASVERCWVHNNEFYVPHISNPAESDKAEGDGSCDFKRGQYFTNSYNYYEGCHKTNLVGSSDTSLQYHLSYHHNYWKYCKARGPLARQANIHMYNNIFEGQTDYAMNTRADAYIFSEYNLFYMVKSPQRVDGGAIKSFGDSFASCINLMQGTVVKNKTDKVSSNNKYANFDTNSSVSYIPSGNYQLQTNVTAAAKVIYAYTGAMKVNPVSPAQVTNAMVSRVPADKYPSSALALPYTQSSAEKISKTVKAFKLNSGATITVAYSSDSVSSTGVLVNEVGQVYLIGSGSVDVPAGVYMIQPMNFQAGSSSALGTFKEVTINSLKIVANGKVETETEAPTQKPVETQVETTTQQETTTQKPTQQETTTQKQTQQETTTQKPTEQETTTQKQTEAVTEPSTEAPSQNPVVTGDGVTHNFTKSDKNSDFYSITGNTSTSKGTVEYAGMKLTKCLKMESATNVKFTTDRKGVLTLVFVEKNNEKAIKVDGVAYASDANGIVTVELEAGEHSLTKANSTNLFYIDLALEAVVTVTEEAHNFTKDDKNSAFYSITGNTSTSKGTVNFAGLTLTKCIKMESATNVTFTAPKAGTLTLVFVEKNNEKAVKIDGVVYASDANGVVTVELKAGTHAISKANSTNLFYMSFVY